VFFLVVGLGGWVLIDFILPAAESKPRRQRRAIPEPQVPGLQWLNEPATEQTRQR
jgi:hypothetical protein